ncbi:MAG: 2-hydroxyglutaryl-CoA dehydratase [Actinobacteria bacterium]|nr:2-hydroxyglutaryl-CoA dehydratase [Actinomycetota bacterium]MBU1943866.1 2-hydroxyglutaryl-CoA dehydratase [Actinomycetota bacterium]MBU2687687.1 2-hydroxyglutaryl-CoA dehydratase [Actinomycetota bacterium]
MTSDSQKAAVATREAYLGVDVGSVSTNVVALGPNGEVLTSEYLRTMGQPIRAVQEGVRRIGKHLDGDFVIRGAGATGSARYLTGVVIGADLVKNEITSHAVAASHIVPGVRTVLEIGGQDSKLILLRDGVVTDFAMNTVCAAGTGSFLDHQSARLGVPVEDFGELALKAGEGAQIAGRCSVFAESDMIHKQQVGYPLEEIVLGLCRALVRNYINNLAKGKRLEPPVVFQGGVAANIGMKRAFEDALGVEITIPPYHDVMGAIGVALLTMDEAPYVEMSNFRGFELSEFEYGTSSFICSGCSNNCEIVKIKSGRETLACWGGRCGKWELEFDSPGARVSK